jgi:hypothetical protein
MPFLSENGFLNFPQSQFFCQPQQQQQQQLLHQQPIFLTPNSSIHSVPYLSNQINHHHHHNAQSFFLNNNNAGHFPVAAGQVLTPLVSRIQPSEVVKPSLGLNSSTLSTPATPITFELVLKPDKKYTQSDFYTFETATSSVTQQNVESSNAELNRQIKLVYSSDLSSEWRILDDNNQAKKNETATAAGTGPVFKNVNEATGSILQKFYLNKNKSESDTTQCKLDFNVL